MVNYFKSSHVVYVASIDSEFLAPLPPETNYKKDNALGLSYTDEHTGFIAQEVQEIIPEAVSTGQDGYLVLHVDPIHWAVVNAIKELAEENELLKKQNAQIKTEAAQTKARLDLLMKAPCEKDQSASFCH